MIYNHNILHTAEQELINDLIEGASSEQANDKYVYQMNETFTDYGGWEMGTAEVERYGDDDEDYEMRLAYGYEYPELFNEAINPSKALKINGFSKELLLNLMYQMVEGNQERLHFYGLLLTDNQGNFINPCNPLVAMELMRNIPYDNPTIIMYPVSEYSYISITKTSENNMVSLWSDVITHISKYATRVPDVKPDVDSIRQVINQSDKTFYDKITMNIEMSLENKEALITPVQIAMVNGIAFPFYGAIYSELLRNNDGSIYESSNIMPMRSGNINDLDINLSDCGDGEEVNQSTELSSTCIGNYSASSSTNFIHMNTMNGSSTYDNVCVRSDLLGGLVKASINMSYNILKGAWNEEKTNKETSEGTTNGTEGHGEPLNTVDTMPEAINA